MTLPRQLRPESPPGVDLTTLVDRVELLRLEATRCLDPERRSELGQFMTPPSVARFMAGLLHDTGDTVRLLDPGAGVGSLTAAAVAELGTRSPRPRRIMATVVEADPLLAPYLEAAMECCLQAAESAGLQFEAVVLQEDFLAAAGAAVTGDLFGRTSPLSTVNAVITNPPYRKIRGDSRERALLRHAGIETSNLYTAFVALSIRLLTDGGQLIAITPRSFCNGQYFRGTTARPTRRTAGRRSAVSPCISFSRRVWWSRTPTTRAGRSTAPGPSTESSSAPSISSAPSARRAGRRP